MANKNFEKFMADIETIADDLKDGADFVNAVYIQNVQEQVRRIKENANDILNTNRELKIGIVGQVKAGKSTFLNALLFHGEDVLPKAATPMTAALTKVTYSEKPSAKVVFYSKTDWEAVEEAAAKYDEEFARLKKAWENAQQERERRERPNSTELLSRAELEEKFTPSVQRGLEEKILPQFRACKELVEMASRNIFEKLGQEENIPLENLKESLAEYVGAHGIYTPIVKYIEMGIANEAIKGIQIVDTPGLGDPILSRSQKTKEFLMACDVVFLLSRASQFLNQEDIDLIVKTLPEDSINHIVLVGSKFDSAMLDDPSRERQTLKNVLLRTRDQLNRRAKNEIAASRRAEKGYVSGQILKRVEEEILAQIESERSLHYISSLLYNAACSMEKGQPVEREAEHVMDMMENRFEGMKRDPAFLRKFAAIERLKEREFARINQRKEEIIAERSDQLLSSQSEIIAKQLNEIQIEAEQNLRIIRSEDMDDLRRKMQTSQEALSAMRRDIQNAFEGCAVDAWKHMVKLANSIKTRTKDCMDINIAEQSSEIRHDAKGMLWWKEPAWIERITYKTANVSDVISNILAYIDLAETEISRSIDKAIDIGTTKNKIKEIVLKAFHKADANFDENDILGPVDTMLAKLTMPPFGVVDRKKYQDPILKKFSDARVIKEEIAKLETQQTLVLREIAEDISKALENKANEIKRVLGDQGVHFVDDVKGQIEAKIKLLETNLQDKEGSVKKYEAFIAKVADCKAMTRITE